MPESEPIIFKKSKRIQSIDIFRGLTIFVMVFVNDVAGVEGLPWWTYHISPGEQGITYVDVVFPAFLFIVGMAIPLALEKRRTKGDSLLRIVYHIVVRSLSLVAIGLLIMNGRDLEPEAAGISYTAWNVLMFVGVILLWNRYPAAEASKKIIFNILKVLGLILLAILLFLYRRESDGGLAWLDLTNWSILGGIGWAYLSAGLLYLIFRGKFTAMVISFLVLVFLNVATKAGWTGFIREIPRIFWPVGSGSLASIVMAGLIMSQLFIKNKVVAGISSKFISGTLFALVLLIMGWLLMPFGLAKIGSTPSWTLFSAFFCVAIYMLMYWIVDMKGFSGWAKFLKPAGSNPLLTYILPDIYYASFGLYHFRDIAGEGWPGVLRALLFTFFILGVSAILTRLKIRLQL